MLAAATVLALGAVAVAYVGPWAILGAHPNPAFAGRLRGLLSAPYLLLVLGVVVVDVLQTIRFGGSSQPPAARVRAPGWASPERCSPGNRCLPGRSGSGSAGSACWAMPRSPAQP